MIYVHHGNNNNTCNILFNGDNKGHSDNNIMYNTDI